MGLAKFNLRLDQLQLGFFAQSPNGAKSGCSMGNCPNNQPKTTASLPHGLMSRSGFFYRRPGPWPPSPAARQGCQQPHQQPEGQRGEPQLGPAFRQPRGFRAVCVFFFFGGGEGRGNPIPVSLKHPKKKRNSFFVASAGTY